jgi:hypothetical protein
MQFLRFLVKLPMRNVGEMSAEPATPKDRQQLNELILRDLALICDHATADARAQAFHILNSKQSME